jgi:Holliday junction resolvase RusA-like endonuclease
VSVTFFIAGVPIPQGSKTAFVVKGRAIVTDANRAKLKPWRDQVADVAGTAAQGVTITGAVEVRADFELVRPVSSKRRYPAIRPDVDKYVRALLDGLTDSGLIKDDGQVVRIVAEKKYALQPGVRVTVGLLPGEEE